MRHLTPHLIEVDETPLGERRALVLVHGIKIRLSHNLQRPGRKMYDWGGWVRSVAENADFQARYKIYLFTYNSANSVDKAGAQLREALHVLLDGAGTRLVIAALSLGGLIVRRALEDPLVWERTDRFLAISVPFHGTPLANPCWIWARLEDDLPLSPARLVTDGAYKLTRLLYPNFDADFGWDNFDGSIPDEIDRRQAAQATAYAPDVDDERYIVYAGYFGTNAVEDRWLEEWLSTGPIALKAGSAEAKLAPPGSRHYGLRKTRPCIADLPTTEAVSAVHEPGRHYYSMMIFNDGISPISSQLWLARFLPWHDDPTRPVPIELQWQALQSLRQNPRVRLFNGLDHRDWLANETRWRDAVSLPDWLHSADPSRTMWEWITHDLMRP